MTQPDDARTRASTAGDTSARAGGEPGEPALAARPEPSSVPVFRKVLVWSARVALAVAVLGAVAGFLLVGANGVWSALVASAIAFGFAGVTVLVLILAARLDIEWFFGLVLGSWLVKLVVFLLVLMAVRGQPWIHPVALWACLVAAVIGQLAVDVVCVVRARMPYVSDAR